MENTLEAGLTRLFGSDTKKIKRAVETPKTTVSVDVSKEILLQQATNAYEAALRAQKDGDWTRYGEEIKRLGEILQKAQP